MSARIALVVGVDAYPNSPLGGCIADAQAIRDVLAGPPLNFAVELVLNADATRANLRRALERLAATDGDVVFYFAGHGVRTPLATYLATVDSEEHDEGIELDFLRRVVGVHKSPPHLFLAILDCCHAGAATIRAVGSHSRSITAPDLRAHLELHGEGSVLLAACRAEESAQETFAGDHGEFTAAVLQGLSERAANSSGEVTVFSLYDYVSRNFDHDPRQTPVFRGDVTGRIVIAAHYPPSMRPAVDNDLLDALTAEGEEHLRDFHAKFATQEIGHYRSHGYRQACDALTPVLEWFRRKRDSVAGLTTHEPFRASYSAAQTRLQNLAALEVGLHTRYGRVEEYLGGGTFGGVWKVSEPGMPDRVIKVYHGHDLRDRDKLTRFQRGYNAMRQLDHPHIVRVFEYSECPVAFVMNFINGPNLRMFHVGSSEPSELVATLLLIAETIQHAHGRDVVHRDIKPENIIMRYEADGRWVPYLTDFDLAWFSTATQVTKDAMGTLFYAAPEQLAKPTSAIAHAPTTDVYAFGQLLFFLLTGTDPVPLRLADNNRALADRLSHGYSQEAGERLMDLYSTCTQSDPSARHATMRRVCDKLTQIHQRLASTNAAAIIPLAQFHAELHYSLVGLVPRDTDHQAYLSLSKRTHVNVTSREEENGSLALEAHLVPNELMLSGRNDAARASINSRIDTSLRGYDNVRRRSGRHGVYEVYIDIRRLGAPSLRGVEKCFEVLSRVIDAIERL